MVDSLFTTYKGRYYQEMDKMPSSFSKSVNKFLYSKYYIFSVASLSLWSNILSFELIVYTIYCILGIYICLFSMDLLPLIPIVICSYFSPSLQNNPGLYEKSIFYLQESGFYILALIGLVLVSLFIRLCFDKRIGFKHLFFTQRKLNYGILFLGFSYLISGILVDNYPDIAIKNVIFASIQFLSLFFFYFLFTGCVNWDNATEDYIVITCISVGIELIIELINIYFTQDVIQDGMIIRRNIYTGWGMHNNLGGMLAMIVPFPFFYLCKRKNILPSLLLVIIFCIGVILSCSRGAILVSFTIAPLCIFYSLVHAKDNRLAVIFLLTLFALLWVTYTKREQICVLFVDILARGLDPMTRDTMYVNGIMQFMESPIFGGSFYPSDYLPWDFSELDAFSNTFPPRWHNTYIQLLASCGLVGLLSYLVHRLQVIIMFAKKRTCLNQIIEFSTLSLIATSLFDCHFFNIGPVLFYSIILAYAEKISPKA